MYNTKNYTEQGGDLTVIGGEINVEGEINVGGNALFSGTIDFSEADMTPILTNQTASTADTIALLKADLNTLLANLKASGLMTADTSGE